MIAISICLKVLWPLPYGVSYNSYLIDDETVALIDTVDICYFEVYLRKIKSIIGERPIQYLIINHMEPDHSGSIRLIKQHYPDIIIVGNKQTFGYDRRILWRNGRAIYGER